MGRIEGDGSPCERCPQRGRPTRTARPRRPDGHRRGARTRTHRTARLQQRDQLLTQKSTSAIVQKKTILTLSDN